MKKVDGTAERSIHGRGLKFKNNVEKTFPTHYSSGLFRLKCHFLDHRVHDLQRLASLSFTDPSLSEHFTMLIKELA